MNDDGNQPERRRRNGSVLPHVLALVAVLSSAAVAITVPFVDSNLERDRLEWQTDEAKREEFRRLLEMSFQRLWHGQQLMFEVNEPLDNNVRERRRLAREVQDTYDKIGFDTWRIQMIAGPSASITRAHLIAANAFGAFAVAVGDSLTHRPTEPILFDTATIQEFGSEARRYVAPADFASAD